MANDKTSVRKFLIRVRLRFAWWLMGNGWAQCMTRLLVIRDLAENAVHRDGRVVLAECEPLARALYEQTPGRWRMTVDRIDEPEPAASPAQAPLENSAAAGHSGEEDNG